MLHKMKKLVALALLSILAVAAPGKGEEKMDNTIYLAGGCFWGVEYMMQLVPGVTQAVSGYANGTLDAPTYGQVIRGDTGHRETVRVTYDPGKVKLEDLLTLYFSAVDPTLVNQQGNDIGTQYQAGIYYTDAKSGEIVRAAAEMEKLRHASFHIEIGPLKNFWDAEEYHQEYLEKNPSGYCHVSPAAFDRAKNLGQEKPLEEAVYQTITPEDARRMKRENHSVIYLDVRTKQEYDLGHLPDAVHLHVDGLERDAAARLPKKNDVILVYSKAGKSSLAAANILVKLGYTDVHDLGSMDDWPYDIQK